MVAVCMSMFNFIYYNLKFVLSSFDDILTVNYITGKLHNACGCCFSVQ